LWLGITIFATFTFFLQKLRIRKAFKESTARLLHAISLFLIFAVPISVIFAYRIGPVVAAPLALCLCVLAMKMHSYYATNTLLAEGEQTPGSPGFYHDGDGQEIPNYPENVEFLPYVRYLFLPTLVYEVHYPMTKKVNWVYAFKELGQMIACFMFIYAILVQYILPIMKEDENIIAVDLLRLSIPTIIMWLLGFYGIFHCFLNSLSEFTGFADRQFYLDWWNSQSLDVFWRKWNLLVHEWLLRHIYMETTRSGTDKKIATLLTFLFSAFMHELIFWVTFQVVRPWFFIGMFVQVPLIIISRYLVAKLPQKNAKRWGNVFVWFR